MVRSFLAADLPGTILDAIEKTTAGLRVSGRDIKWVNVRNIHLTLKFFGDIEEGQIDPISWAVRDAVAEVQPVSLQAAGIGAFPSLTRPRVIWVGVGGESGRLVLMQKRIDDTLASLGFPAEMRPFSPHLTVGRIRPGAKAPDLAGRTDLIRYSPIRN